VCVAECFLDLCFLVDQSGSINFKDSSNWDKQLNFVANLTDRLTNGANAAQVALIVFGDSATVKWGLTQYRDKASLIAAIMNLRYPTDGEATNLNYALYLTRTQIFAPGAGSRPSANKVTIIVTDGEDTEPVKGTVLTIQNATACKNEGIRLIGIGVSEEVDTDRLLQIVSSPSDYYPVGDFNALPRLVIDLTPTICVTSTTTPAPPGPSTTTYYLLYTF